MKDRHISRPLTFPLSPFVMCLGANTKYVSMPFSSRYSHLSPPLPGSSSNSPCRLSFVVWEMWTFLDRPENLSIPINTTADDCVSCCTQVFHQTPSYWLPSHRWTKHQTATSSGRALHPARCQCEHPHACPPRFWSSPSHSWSRRNKYRIFLLRLRKCS